MMGQKNLGKLYNALLGLGMMTVMDILKWDGCYESKLKGLSNETTLVLSNTRELDRVPKTK